MMPPPPGYATIHRDHQINKDELTGRPNRCLFIDRLQQAMKRSRRDQSLVGILYLDIDYLGQINDLYSRDVGDQVLKSVGDILTGCIRSTDTVARLKEDDFAILMEELHVAGAMDIVTKKIMDKIRQPLHIDAILLNVTISIGAVIYNNEKIQAEYLLNQADIALYRAKNSGRNQISF